MQWFLRSASSEAGSAAVESALVNDMMRLRLGCTFSTIVTQPTRGTVIYEGPKPTTSTNAAPILRG